MSEDNLKKELAKKPAMFRTLLLWFAIGAAGALLLNSLRERISLSGNDIVARENKTPGKENAESEQMGQIKEMAKPERPIVKKLKAVDTPQKEMIVEEKLEPEKTDIKERRERLFARQMAIVNSLLE